MPVGIIFKNPPLGRQSSTGEEERSGQSVEAKRRPEAAKVEANLSPPPAVGASLGGASSCEPEDLPTPPADEVQEDGPLPPPPPVISLPGDIITAASPDAPDRREFLFVKNYFIVRFEKLNLRHPNRSRIYFRGRDDAEGRQYAGVIFNKRNSRDRRGSRSRSPSVTKRKPPSETPL